MFDTCYAILIKRIVRIVHLSCLGNGMYDYKDLGNMIYILKLWVEYSKYSKYFKYFHRVLHYKIGDYKGNVNSYNDIYIEYSKYISSYKMETASYPPFFFTHIYKNYKSIKTIFFVINYFSNSLCVTTQGGILMFSVGVLGSWVSL